MEDAQSLWSNCCDVLRGQVSDATWRSTFRDAEPVSFDEEVLSLAVPNGLARDRIEGRFLPLVKGALQQASGEEIGLDIQVQPGSSSSSGTGDDRFAFEEPRSLFDTVTLEPPKSPVSASVDSEEQDFSASRKYSFAAFVTGPSNRFAHAAALSVAETPGRSYNPLFIYGDAGLGKTHLLQAIGHYVRENYPHYQVRYSSAEAFLNDFIEAIRTGARTPFQRRYRDVNVLLVDDIQYVHKWNEAQEEFFHTFNALFESNRQIVLSSDRPPDAIPNLEHRLRSRFKMGLISDIQPPDLETRRAIVGKKAERQPVWIPDEVQEFIATNITDNIRELEGALTRVAAFGSLTKEPLTVSVAERVLADILGDRQPRPITPILILEQTSDMFGIPVAEIVGKSRRRPLVTARQVAMYVMREVTDLSYPAIAHEFGGRDHTTVIHAVDKIKGLMGERQSIYQQVTELIGIIKKGR